MTQAESAWYLDWPGAFRAGATIAGGKGWNLGRLDHYGFPIPPGGVLTAAAYAAFVAHNGLSGLIDEASRHITAESLGSTAAEAILERLRQAILGSGFPASIEGVLRRAGDGVVSLAVRSSAACEDAPEASFAGIHDSFLNVRGADAALDAVRGCYASLWTPRAVAYRRRMEIADAAAAMAVVVMAMAPTHAAGVAFSCDPATGSGDTFVVDATFGLGESLVAGRIEPDHYQIDIVPHLPAVRRKTLGAKAGEVVADSAGGTAFRPLPPRRDRQVLNDRDIVRLAVLVGRVVEALGEGFRHQDVEWAFDGKSFVLLQARPVTSSGARRYAGLAGQPEIWSNANLRDSLPNVLSTLYWSLIQSMMAEFFSTPLRAGHYVPLPGTERIRLWQGRPYFNLSVLQWEIYDAFGLRPASINQTLGGHQPEIAVPTSTPLGPRLARARRAVRLALAMLREKRGAPALLAEIERVTDDWQRRVTPCASDDALNALAAEMRRISLPLSMRALLLNGVGISFGALVRVLERPFPGRGNALANALLAGRSGITSAEHGLHLVELAELAQSEPDVREFLADPAALDWQRLPEQSPFKRHFAEFLERYGHRGIYELDIMNPRWHEAPGYLLDNIRALLGSADAEAFRARQRATAEQAWNEIRGRLGPLRRALVARFAREAAADARLREAVKSALVRVSAVLRAFGLELGRRLAARGLLADRDDVFHCSRMELLAMTDGDWDGRGLAVLVSERRARAAEQQARPAPDLIVDEQPSRAAPAAAAGSQHLSGMGVATGIAEGTARVVRHPADGVRLASGEILVAPSTDPAWTPLFLRASAIVMETGGQLSHGAIVAREYGVPAVVNIPGLLERIGDGDRILVNGDTGEIRLLGSATCPA